MNASRTLAALVAPAFLAASANAQPAPDKWAYTLANPTPREHMRDLSPDRPDTTESPYTVDAGHAQVELSFIDYSRDEPDDGGTSHGIAIAPMLLKVGLTNNIDLQLGIDPYLIDRVGGADGETTSGFGDTVLRLKVNIWGNDSGDTALAVMPFVKFPTASDGLGNDSFEGGLIVPLAIALPAGFGLTVMAEIDFLRSAADDRYVFDLVHTATIGREIIGDLSGYVEYAGFINLSHDEDYRASFGTGLTLEINPDTLLDVGLRVGLTDASEDIGLFAGMTVRF